MAARTSPCMRASCAGVGWTLFSPSSCTRTVEAPTKLATLTAMPLAASMSRYSASLSQVTLYLMSSCLASRAAFMAGVHGPMLVPSPITSSVTPCFRSESARPSWISDSLAQLSMLMKPGATAWPVASMRLPAIPAGGTPAPMALIRSPSIASQPV